MRRRKPFEFYNETFSTRVHFCPGLTSDSVAKSMLKNYGVELPSPEESHGAYSVLAEGEDEHGIYIWLPSNSKDQQNLDFLVHECVHVANMILQVIGANADFTNDETQAYLTAWIFSKCCGHLK